MLRLEIRALENSAAQTEKAIDSLLVATRSGRRFTMRFEDEGDVRDVSAKSTGKPDLQDMANPRRANPVTYIHQSRRIPSIDSNFEPVSNRFSDRTITQSCALLLRESGGPLHVNELYNLLVAGGMKFKGNNPTISVAVSLSRNRRFRKVDPGTFDLVIREATQDFLTKAKDWIDRRLGPKGAA